MEPQILNGVNVEVVDRAGHRSLRAKQAFKEGDTILVVKGDRVDTPSKYSIQVGIGQHIEPGAVPVDQRNYDDYLWPFLNHGFSPNAAMNGESLIALSDIEVGAEITFNYNANEWLMATPFVCMKTGREVGGFKRLGPADRAELYPICSTFIRTLEENERQAEAEADSRFSSASVEIE
jgi:hypothetical protein